MKKFSSRLPKIFVQTEISVTEPAHPLILTVLNFHKGFSYVLRSRKPDQPDQPGSYDEAISLVKENALRESQTNLRQRDETCPAENLAKIVRVFNPMHQQFSCSIFAKGSHYFDLGTNAHPSL